MELVRGVPITDYCDRNGLDTRARLDLILTVCQAVQHAHQRGIIHRDLKPTNILVTLHDGVPVVKIIDFGIAKALGQQLTEKTLFTGFAQLVGTPLYMSPEQAELSGLDVDTRTDVYALAVLMYELLTGTTPFDQERLSKVGYDEMRRIIREEDPVKPSTRISTMGEAATVSARRHSDPKKLSLQLQGELDWIVMKGLEKDRNRRYETAGALAADVERYLHDEPVLACPPSSWYRFRKFARRHRWPLALAGVAASALIVITTGSLLAALYLNQALHESEGNRRRAKGAEEAARSAAGAAIDSEKEAKERLFDSLLAQGRARRLSRRMGQRFESLAALADATKLAQSQSFPAAKLLELRNEVIACLPLPDLRVFKEWDGNPAGSSLGVDFDDKMERYARVDAEGHVSVRRVADDSRISDWSVWPGESGAEFSRDGRFLAIERFGRIQVWNLSGPKPELVLSESARASHAFSPDSHWFALALRDRSISLFELPSWRRARRLARDSTVRGVAFAPEGRRLSVATAARIEILDLETGKVEREFPLPQPPYPWVGWHPEGKMVAAVGLDWNIYLWDAATGKQITKLQGSRGYGIRCAFNHKGDLLASAGWDGMMRLLDWRTGQQLFSTHAGYLGTPRFSPEDRLLAGDIEGTKVRLWEINAGSEYRTLTTDPAFDSDGPTGLAVRGDGRLLAVAMHNGLVLWDLGTSRAAGYTPIKGRTRSVYFESADALLTYGDAGLLRWSLQADSPSSQPVKIGDAQKLPPPGGFIGVALSQDHRIVAIARINGALVLDRNHADHPVPLGPHGDVRLVAVSPDGQWVATGRFSYPGGAKIWQTDTGRLIKDLPVGGSCQVAFSPDGAWLATTGGSRLRLWSSGSWTEGPVIPGNVLSVGYVAFSPDNKAVAVETGKGVVRLIDLKTGQDLAQLEDPNQERAGCIAFSPRGDQLITTSFESNSIHVWDLAAIRRQLAEMKLNWD
jgi:eukaryotic-like serine/threonine-protein kinase